MNPSEPSSGLDVEALVRARLERDAEGIDPRPLFRRIRYAAAPRRRGRDRVVRALWRGLGVATAAAALVLGFQLLLHDRTALAKGETVVREARSAHAQPIDRCYLVEVRRESPLAAELSLATPQVRLTLLWTRGDRFWVESARPEPRWAWGRDEADRFWIAFGPHTAVRLDADEVPYGLNLYCDLHSLNVERWLAEVLDRFELTRETGPPGAEASTIKVHARARLLHPQRPGVRTADFEIDAETRVVRRMVVRRVLNGEPFATVTSTLAETAAIDPARYRLEGHLAEPSEIFTRDHEPQRRKDLLARWFGPLAGRGFRPLEAVK